MRPRFPVPRSGRPAGSNPMAYTMSCPFDHTLRGEPSGLIRYNSEPPEIGGAAALRAGGGPEACGGPALSEGAEEGGVASAGEAGGGGGGDSGAIEVLFPTPA